jgi:hypothetical protein
LVVWEILREPADKLTVDFFSRKSEYSAFAGVVDHPPASRESEVRARQGVRGAQVFPYAEGYRAELACSPILGQALQVKQVVYAG